MVAGGVGAAAAMRLGSDTAKTRRLVDVPRGDQDALGPQRDFPVAVLPGESEGFADQPRADAEPTRRRFDQQQPQFGDVLALPDEEHRADRLAFALGDPAALAARLEFGDEPGCDFSDQRLEPLVEATFLRV